MRMKLNPEPARQDLTLREVSKILGGTIGGLCSMADKETIEQAIRWWSENFSAAGVYEMTKAAEEQLRKAQAARTS